MRCKKGMVSRAGERRRVTFIDDDVFRTLWADETKSIAEIGRMLNASQWDIGKQARRLGLPPRQTQWRGKSPDPSEEEIAALCLEIQRTRWDEKMMSERCQGNGAVAWTCPEFSISRRGVR